MFKMIKPYLVIIPILFTHQAHAELWRDVTDQPIRDRGQTLIINEIFEKQEDGQFLVTFKNGFAGSTFYGLDKLLVNCSNNTVRILGGRFYARDYRPTNNGTPGMSTYIDMDRAPEFRQIYNTVCRE